MIEKNKDLKERTFQFAVEIIKIVRVLEKSTESNVISFQLAKAGTSIGANYEESQGTYSKEEFLFKISICLKEVREANYWLRIIEATNMVKNEKIKFLIKESEELKNIFGAILRKKNAK
ncbi:MAG: four helix bundle protein [Candidatus Omnitrophica bacterium]|nr:four helix bundle protein [Candidatus Omnitrophota bacterium]